MSTSTQVPQFSPSRFERQRRFGMSRMAQREAIEGYLCILPWILGFLIFQLGPILASFFFSFTDYNIATYRWIGVENFRRLFFEDDLFLKSLWNTMFYAGISVPLGLATALLVAVLLNQKIPGVSLFRTMYYLPSVTPVVAMSVLWLWLFNPLYGLLNSLLRTVGIPGPGWLVDPMWSKPAFILMSLWGIGGAMVIFLAGLQGIPKELHEAATIDGAGRWRAFWSVTFPLLGPVLFFNLIMGMIAAFQIFTQAFIITNGGPLNSTLFYVLYLFRQAFRNFRMGYASAMAWILFLVVLVLTIIQFRFVGRHIYYEEGGDS